MKIPQVLAQESVALARIPRIGSSFNGQGEAALGQGIANVGVALGRIAEAEQAKRNQFGRDEAAHAAAAVELDLKTFGADLDVTERDPDRYEQAMQRRVQETTDRAAAALTSEEGRAVFQQKMGPALVDLLVGARRRANTLYVERGTAMLDDTTANTLALIGATRFGDDETFLRQTRNGYEAITGAMPYLGAVETGKRRRAFQTEALETYANSAIEANQFDPTDSRWVGMDPGRFEIIRRRAATVAEARVREEIRLEEKLEKKEAKEAERERQRLVDNLDELADNGDLTAEMLRSAKEDRIAIDDDYRRLATKVREGTAAGGRTSDAIYNKLELDLLENPFSHSAREIRRIQAAGNLAASGPRSAATLLKMIPDSEAASAKDITQRPLFKQGLHELRESLRGGVGPLESLTREQATRLENAEREYHDIARSGKVGDQEFPEVARKIVDRVRKQVPAVGDPETRRLLRYQTPQDLLAAKQAGLINDAEFNRQFKLLQQLGLIGAGPQPKESSGGR